MNFTLTYGAVTTVSNETGKNVSTTTRVIMWSGMYNGKGGPWPNETNAS